MNREQEARLVKYANDGKTSKHVTLWVLNKNTNVVNPILGSMLSGFMDSETYEIYDQNPAIEEVAEVENAPPVKRKKAAKG